MYMHGAADEGGSDGYDSINSQYSFVDVKPHVDDVYS